MNWKRILIFTLILFVATAGAAFPFGFVGGFLTRMGKPIPSWLGIGQAVAVVVASILVFLFLALRQRERAFAHALVVGLASWVVTFPLNVILFGQPPAQWAAGVTVFFIAVPVGVLCGSAIARRREPSGAVGKS